jgi:hypothetical protein
MEILYTGIPRQSTTACRHGHPLTKNPTFGELGEKGRLLYGSLKHAVAVFPQRKGGSFPLRCLLLPFNIIGCLTWTAIFSDAILQPAVAMLS